MVRKAIIQLAMFGCLTAALLFGPAGTFNYPAAWLYLAIVLIGGALTFVWLYFHDPRLLQERLSSPVQRRQSGWDRVFILAFMIFATAWIAFCAWDAARQGFLAVPIWAQGVGALALALQCVGVWLTFRENTFAAPVVKVQGGHRVIDSGPYGIVRHPMYASMIAMFFGAPLLLGSWLGLIGSAVLTLGFAWRAVREEQTLAQELPDYAAYKTRVRWRFVPAIW